MGIFSSKPSFDDIIQDLSAHDIKEIGRSGSVKFQKGELMFVIRKEESGNFSIHSPGRGIFYFDTSLQALNIVNMLCETKSECRLVATIWGVENPEQREIRFEFLSNNQIRVKEQHLQLQSILEPLDVQIGELNDKNQVVSVVHMNYVILIHKLLSDKIEIKWRDYTNKM